MFFENIKLALKSLKSHKMRSLLTMLGIIIGIGSVITIVALGEGGKKIILGQFEAIGSSTIIIGTKTSDKSDMFNSSDIAGIRENIDSVKYVSPMLEMYGQTILDGRVKQNIVSGVGEDMLKISNLTLISGRFINSRDILSSRASVVIDESTAKYFFKTSDCVGEDIYVKSYGAEKKFTVVGVVKDMLGDIPTTGIEEIDDQIPNIIYIPYPVAEEYFGVYNNQIYVVGEDPEKLDELSNLVQRYLHMKHRNSDKNPYKVTSLVNILEQINVIMNIVTSFIGAVAAISLFVGGIGIMNILLVSVTERTREIGIQKALGATTKIILYQFLTEAIVLSLIGGILGIIVGISGAWILGSMANIVPILSIKVVIVTLVFSSCIGLFFGIYPAKKAASLNPIDALRYE